jgi:hypothetical protein
MHRPTKLRWHRHPDNWALCSMKKR